MNLNEWMQAHPDLFSSSPLDNAMYFQAADIKAASASSSNTVQVPAEAPSGIYQVQFPSLYNLNPLEIEAFNQGKMGTWDTVLSILYLTNPAIINPSGTMRTEHWMFIEGSASFTIPGGAEIVRLSCWVNHTTGSPTDFFKFKNGTEDWSPDSFLASCIIQQIA